MKSSSFEPGMRAEVHRVVTSELTAERLGSGDVPVLGTPSVLAMMEEASVAAVRDYLEEGTTSVGVAVELEHLAPSRIGAEVRAVAELVGADDRRLSFACEAYEGEHLIARAAHRRIVVDRNRFLAGS